jgi:hypothetical protein
MSAWMGQPRLRLPRFAEDAVERARLTVVPRRRTRAPRVPFMILVSLVLLTGVVGLLLFNTHMQQASFRATALEAEAKRLHATEQSLRMELDTLRDPQRVATQAQSLGMVPMVNPAFIRLSDGDLLGNPVPAAASDAQRLTPLPPPKPQQFRVPRAPVLAGATPDTGADGVPSDVPGAAAGTTD